jgi:hypothetical protein
MSKHYGWVMVAFSVSLIVGMVAMALSLAGLAGCCPSGATDVDPNTGQVGIRTTDGLSDQIASDVNLPYDRAAVLAAIGDLIEPDLSSYRFAIMFIFQNMFDRDIAFDVFVNGQRIERRKVQAARQEIVPVTNDEVLATEAITGIPSTPVFGKPTPFIVTFANFVCSDDHIITDQSFILAPLNAFRTNLEPITKDSPPLKLPPVYVCPSIIMLVVEKTRIRAIELDRDFSVPDYTAHPQEPGDPTEDLFPFAAELEWSPEEITLFNNLDMGFIIQPF